MACAGRDDAALARLAAQAVPREKLQAEYRGLCGSSDLFPHGYFVRHWVRFSDLHEVCEYLPRNSSLPRLTAGCYAEQVAIHAALGLNLVPPGAPWEDYGHQGLFDGLFAAEGGAE